MTAPFLQRLVVVVLLLGQPRAALPLSTSVWRPAGGTHRAQLTMRVGKRGSRDRGKGTVIDSFKSRTIKAKTRQRRRGLDNFDANKVFVGNLPFNVTTDELWAFAERIGTVSHAKVLKDRWTGRSKGYGFVRYCSPLSAATALHALAGTELQGRVVNVQPVAEQPPEDAAEAGDEPPSPPPPPVSAVEGELLRELGQ